MAYVDAKTLENLAEAPEGTDANVFKHLAEAASMQFDRLADLSSDFFAKAKTTSTLKYFRGNGTEYVKIPPYIFDSIEEVAVDFKTIDLDSSVPDFYELDNFLVFNYEILRNTVVSVTAKWGFTDVPADVKQAVIEQALFLWRKKDLLFADLSGVSSAVVNAETSGTFAAVAKKYNELYAGVNFA